MATSSSVQNGPSNSIVIGEPECSTDVILSPPTDSELQAPDFVMSKTTGIRCRSNVCYIVAGILVRGTGSDVEVCLIQEARDDHSGGSWYIPAGHVEPGESLVAATQREVKEEAGYEVRVDDLTSVESQGGGWYRFTFYCKVTGGELKQIADEESLAAKWFKYLDIKAKKVKLRGRDCIVNIEKTLQYYQHVHGSNDETSAPRPQVQVCGQNVTGMFLRLVIVRRKNQRWQVLLSKDTGGVGNNTLPIVEYGLTSFVPAVVSKFYRELIEEGNSALQLPSRVIGVRCLPSPVETTDHGLCLTLLCPEKSRMSPQLARPDRYFWCFVEEKQCGKQLEKLMSDGPAFMMA